jgi:4-nitrophenyl phosphatase
MSKIAGVILAAGASARFGKPKQLLHWDGTTLVARAADTALAAGLDPVLVVLGSHAEMVRSALEDRAVQPVMNWRWSQGMSTSVQTGLAMLPPAVDAVVFLQCDQPLISAGLLLELVSRFEKEGAPIVRPSYRGQQGTPVLIGRRLFGELAAVRGDQGARPVIARHHEDVATVEVADPEVLADIDTPEDYERLLKRHGEPRSPTARLRGVRHLIVDMDGVLWRGDEPLPGLETFFAFLRDQDIEFVLVTNNASKRPGEYVQKLRRLGIEIPVKRILTSAQATAAYLRRTAPPGSRVHVLGMEGLRHAIAAGGLTLADDEADYVVVGWTIDLNWQKLAAAALQIRRGAEFIGTNPDETFPSEMGLMPGNGAILAALETATGVAPRIIGKPEPWLYREAMERMGAQPETTAVVGDRLGTDILGGVKAGILTVLVLSGVTSQADLAESAIRPDLVHADIAELVQAWREEGHGV